MREEPPPQAHPVTRQYDRWASIYDTLWQWYVDQTLPVLQNWAALRSGERVLDVGCGTGAFEQRVVDSGADNEIVGVDLSENMLARARAKLADHSQISFRQADVHDLPFEDATFDVIVSASTFHYFDAPEQALDEMARVLRSGGRLVVLDWCQDFWMCQMMDVVLGIADPAYQRCFTLDEMRAFIAETPLALRRVERLRVGWIWGMMIVEAVRPTER